MASLLAVVHGRVQGVGFRWFVQRHAEAAGLVGFVRNRQDGTVEFEAEGPVEILEAFLETVRRGPSMSRVTDIEVTWGDRESGRDGFDITY